MSERSRRAGALITAGILAAGAATAATSAPGWASSPASHPPARARDTATPIRHVVVIFGENVSFDHYFGTYPKAANTDGTKFVAAPGTPKVNGLTPELLTHNPNATNPRRLTPAQALTCDQDHGYKAEQLAFNGGKMDKFVENTSRGTCAGQPTLYGRPGLVMDYYDGNTVTGLWNYAQHFAMSDNSFGTVFGPSTPGALNLVSGQTSGAYAVDPVTHNKVSDPYVIPSPNTHGIGTVINDPDPAFDDCSDSNHTTKNNLAVLTGRNIGDLLNAKGVTWGWFQGGFRPTGHARGYAVCGATHRNIGGISVTDYVPHHEPFQYYRSTANEKHLPPSSVAAIGHTDRANHQYDLADFDAALRAHHLPAVSFLKAAAYQNAHPANSDPLDEQRFVVDTINKLQRSPEWSSTAVILAYDDSDGWYDHQKSPIVNHSNDPRQDAAVCAGRPDLGDQIDRCGYGPRLPLLVISPYARRNAVSHAVTDQTSILRFIEENWRLGPIGGSSFDRLAGRLTGPDGLFDFRHPRFGRVLLDPTTGAVVSAGR